MARYIDADALMEKLFSKLKDGAVLYRISPQEIYDAPTADVAPRNEWISVEERLPDKVGIYLACTHRGSIISSEYAPFYVGGNPQFGDYVAYWMPLPEPPQMKGK